MDVALLIWTVALTILVIVGVVWMLDLQARLRRMKSQREKLLAGARRYRCGRPGPYRI